MNAFFTIAGIAVAAKGINAVSPMEAKKENRGGARPGAGRKPSPVKRAAVTIYLTPEQRAALDYLRSRAVDTSAICGRELLRLADIHKLADK